MREDYKHVNEFGDIEAFKDTPYWFGRDWKTFKNSFKSTLKHSPIVFLFAILPTIILCVYYKTNNISFIMVIFVMSFLLSLYGYFMFHVLVTKGYDIGRWGTTVKDSKKGSG